MEQIECRPAEQFFRRSRSEKPDGRRVEEQDAVVLADEQAVGRLLDQTPVAVLKIHVHGV